VADTVFRVYDFRRAIQEKTNVPPDRQKLVGLIKGSGKLSNELDGTRFGTLGVKKGDVKFTMIGTPEDQSHVDMPLFDVSCADRV
jgi:ubiquitin-like domain-containing CTD phosphatase 1